MILIVKLLKELFCPWSSLKVQYLCNLCPLRKAVMLQEHHSPISVSTAGIQQLQHYWVNSAFHEAEQWGQYRVNNCLICHWDLVLGRTRRADRWTKELLLPWAASLGADYGSVKRSWSKLKAKGDPWTWGCSSWIYGDCSDGSGWNGVWAAEAREWTHLKGSALSPEHNQLQNHHLPAVTLPAQQGPAEGRTWRQVTLLIL